MAAEVEHLRVVQAVVVTQASEVVAKMKAAGIRAVLDTHDTLNYRIREAEMMKVPYMAVVGRREAEAGTLAVRARGAGKKQDILPIDEFIQRVLGEIATRALTP